ERCQGDGCTAFAQIFTLSGTTFNNTGLTASTSYSYQVRAIDAAGNLGPYSSVASATTLAAPDTTAPTAPSGLSATAAGSTQINLSWSAARVAAAAPSRRSPHLPGRASATPDLPPARATATECARSMAPGTSA